MAVAALGPQPAQGRTAALLLTWALMGLWHGAAWTFVLWGLYHGLVVLLYRVVPALGRYSERHPHLAQGLMLAAVMFGWIPFRARSLEQAFHLWGLALNPTAFAISPEVLRLSSNTACFSYFFAFALTIALPLIYAARHTKTFWVQTQPATFLKYLLLTSSLVFLSILYFNTTQQFIYFQF